MKHGLLGVASAARDFGGQFSPYRDRIDADYRQKQAPPLWPGLIHHLSGL